jgi:hypothetical protein
MRDGLPRWVKSSVDERREWGASGGAFLAKVARA